MQYPRVNFVQFRSSVQVTEMLDEPGFDDLVYLLSTGTCSILDTKTVSTGPVSGPAEDG
jgi:hypothetical protein